MRSPQGSCPQRAGRARSDHPLLQHPPEVLETNALRASAVDRSRHQTPREPAPGGLHKLNAESAYKPGTFTRAGHKIFTTDLWTRPRPL